MTELVTIRLRVMLVVKCKNERYHAADSLRLSYARIVRKM